MEGSMLHRMDPSGSVSSERGPARDHVNGHARPRRTHIAVFVKNFQYGGTQRVLLRLANKLHQYGHRVQVVSPGRGPLQASLHPGVEHVHLRPTSEVYGRMLALLANPQAAARLLLPVVLPMYPIKG